GAGPRGPVAADLGREGAHLLIEGPRGSGRTELLRAVAASLAAGARPDRLGLLLVEGAGGMRGEGLAALTELPHVTEHLVASDPVRMREFAQALGAELKRRAELLGGLSYAQWRQAHPAGLPVPEGRSGDVGTTTRTLRLRPGAARAQEQTAPVPDPLPRLVVLVDDVDALVAPALGSPGRPAAGSQKRAFDAVAPDGERLGVHLVAASAADGRAAGGELARAARRRAVLDAPPVTPAP
ncbi:FtsK/SpoIIIE domain-containing protein, partial [Streptomyces tremellae]|uniref:FtsK/SpoIIIE domain-containing protein n=1 Tax=Streptomyces tremellae TaxID=1124239 RepID=UPI0031E71B94